MKAVRSQGYVGGAPHQPRKVLDWSTWREAHGKDQREVRYVTQSSVPVILRRLDDRKAVAHVAVEGSPRWGEKDHSLPGSMVRTSPVSNSSTVTGGSTPREAMMQAVQAVQAMQAMQGQMGQAGQVHLPIQGRSAWTPSNVKAASREVSSPARQVEFKPEVEVQVCEPTEESTPEIGERSEDVKSSPSFATSPQETPLRPKRLVLPHPQESAEGPKSRSNSIGGTPEVVARKISSKPRVPDLTDRAGGVRDSPKRKSRTDTRSGSTSRLEEPSSPGARASSTRRSRDSEGGASRLTRQTRASAAHAEGGRARREAESRSPGRRGASMKLAEDAGERKSRPSSARSRKSSPSLQERASTAMQALEHGMEPPGASDKWRVAQLFYESVPRSHAKIHRIERLLQPEQFANFLTKHDGGANACRCGIAFAESSPNGRRIRLVSEASVVVKELMDQMGAEDAPMAVSLSMVLCSPSVSEEHLGGAGDRCWESRRFVCDESHTLLAYMLHFQLSPGNSETAFDFERGGSPSPRSRSASRQRKVSVGHPLIQGMLGKIARLRSEASGTVLLPSNSEEAEAVVSLYLQSGGAARLRRPPGVDLREALGGVVVQRFENKSLAQDYLAIEVDSQIGPRFKEDVVWHGTRLKRSDGDATLAHKLQSIAEQGFDPQRCIKGAHAEGGIWVASCPMESFGVGGDGLVAFVVCLAKTHYNEWVDTACARVLQRERVLPLYSLVHV